MSQECCRAGLKNFGRLGCTTQIDRVVVDAFTPTFDATNQYNRIDLDAVFTQTTLTNLITNALPQNRIVASPKLKNVTLPTADTTFDTATDDSKSFVREGLLSFAGEVRDKDAVPPMLKNFKSLRCKDVSVYLVTASNQLICRKVAGDDQYVYPLTINSGSVDPKMMFRNDTETNKIMLGFDFESNVKPEDLYVLDGNDLGVDFVNMRQLIDVNILETATAITATTIEVDVKTNFAQGLHPNNDVVGLTAPSFALKNLTTASTITITTVVEDVAVDGRYLITFPAQTAGDVMELSMVLTTYYVGALEFDAV